MLERKFSVIGVNRLHCRKYLITVRVWLGLSGDGTVDVLNVKCDPMLAGSLRQQDGFHPAYHMNKDKWLSVRLDGSAPDNEIKSLIDLSYDLTAAKNKKKRT